MRFLKVIGYILLVLLALVLAAYLTIYLWALAMPAIAPMALTSSPDPASSYDEAMARFDALLAAEQARGDIDEKCLPYVLTHGQRTTRSIILFHGLTACPFQYHALAELFYEQGYNVYVPRLPRHGYLDRTSNALADLTAEELAAMMDATADLAAGLGEEVTMAGLSLGGNVAAQGGQLRADLRLAVPMSPAFGFRFAPDFLTPALTRLILGLSPDIYIWWDPINKADFQAESGYPGFSLRAWRNLPARACRARVGGRSAARFTGATRDQQLGRSGGQSRRHRCVERSLAAQRRRSGDLSLPAPALAAPRFHFDRCSRRQS